MKKPIYFSHPAEKIAAYMLIIGLSLLFLYLASPILIPLTYGAVFSLLLYPICKFFERNGFGRILSITLTLLTLMGFMTILLYLLSNQIFQFVNDLPSLADRIDKIGNEIEFWIFRNFNIRLANRKSLWQSSIERFADTGVVLLQGTLSTFLALFNFLGLVPVYIFMFLLYRTAFKDYLLYLVPKEKHRVTMKIIVSVQNVVQSYISGLLTVMAIVGVMNISLLLMLDVDYPWFFGILASMLMIIPYIGVFIGSLLPAIYALITKDSPYTALAIMAGFSVVQFLEGNFITPRITGDKVQINALTAIVGLIVAGYLWGASGLILAMPLIAILKVVLDNVTGTRALGYFLGSEMSTKTSTSDTLHGRLHPFIISPSLRSKIGKLNTSTNEAAVDKLKKDIERENNR